MKIGICNFKNKNITMNFLILTTKVNLADTVSNFDFPAVRKRICADSLR